MSILSDRQIHALCENTPTPMIVPYMDHSVRETSAYPEGIRALSFGLSSFGYDVTLADDFKLFTNIYSRIVDPKRLDDRSYVVIRSIYDEETHERYVLLPPNSYLLGHTVEVFDIPRDIMVVAVGKSSYARAAVLFNCTPIEAGFKGQVVVELANASNLPVKIYVNEGIGQFLFFRGDEDCRVSYADRSGKYQGQMGLQLPLV